MKVSLTRAIDTDSDKASPSIRRPVSWVVTSLLLTAVVLTFAEFVVGFVACFVIALLVGLSLATLVVMKRAKGRRRLILTVLAMYLGVSWVLLTHYSWVRDHARWLLLADVYRTRVLAGPAPADGRFRHAEWDCWGFLDQTTAFLVFDPTDSLAGASGAAPPVKARGLPCDVFRVRQLASHWYAVLFYTDTYWGQEGCR